MNFSYKFYQVKYKKDKADWVSTYQAAVSYAEFLCESYPKILNKTVDIYGVINEVSETKELIAQIDCKTKKLNIKRVH